ncbi:MAG TPA: L-seryl-tRNA(Sec) selenium transferase [Terriglobales bacterium]|nr:L-seryl-tRNA(Sec) selenium transferase [Terriglobales bacterium]
MKALSKSDLYRKLPSVDELLRSPDLADAVASEGHVAVTDAARAVLERLREEIGRGSADAQSLQATIPRMVENVRHELHRSLAFALRPVINATGVILHTNLGRAPLAGSAIDNLERVSAGYSNLELDLESGERGKRDAHVDRLFKRLFRETAENSVPSRELSTIVVNNNAAAVWLALNTLAARAEVIVSRGELVEIGGSFRIPDVMEQSNATLREVGTTNRTRVADYERAISENTRVLLRVHRSNFQIIGFTEQPDLKELVALARSRKLTLVEDLGSGALFNLDLLGIRGESRVADSLRAGVDLVTYSGDKLLGGPQAGMLTGNADLIKRMRSNSLFRALRVDKLTYAALEATLAAYAKENYDSIPALRMMRASKEEIGERAEAIAHQLRDVSNLTAEVIDGESVIGGGAAPSSTLPTRLLAVKWREIGADTLLARLRSQELPLIARAQEGRVLIDLRTVFPEQDQAVTSALRTAGS